MFSISVLIKGFVVGATMMVPGVSGGSMAMILGIYDQLISSVSSFFKDIKKNFMYLLQFGLAGIIGIVLCARPIMGIIDRFPVVSMFFFIGLVFGSVPMLYKKAKIGNFHQSKSFPARSARKRPGKRRIKPERRPIFREAAEG